MLGYGSGRSLNEAKQQAYSDIAEQISVRVASQSELQTTQQQDTVTRNYQSQINTFSRARLDDLSIECLDKQDPAGNIHLLLGYDLRPLYAQISDKLITLIGHTPGSVRFSGPDFLTQSKLAADVKEALLKNKGSKAFNAEIELKRLDNKWQWIIAEQPFFLDNNELHLAVDWQKINTGSSQISAISKKGLEMAPLVKTETEFRLKTTTMKDGYLQIIAIYENGEVDVIRSNVSTHKYQQHITPKIPGIFEAGLIKPGIAATDVYLAVITREPLAETQILTSGGTRGSPFYLTTVLSNLEKYQPETNIHLLTITPK